MIKKTCKVCGKEFKSKPSEDRKYCSRECYNKDRLFGNVKSGKSISRVEVTCAICGKKELVYPSRSNRYLCCSVECLSEYNRLRYSKKIKCVCEVCGKEFYLKPYYYNRAKHHCCSKKCSSILKKKSFVGENNHQFSLKGKLNATFKDSDLFRKNGKLLEVMTYSPETPGSNKSGRIEMHRKIIIDNKDKFDSCFFKEDGSIRDGVIIHHIDRNHCNNVLENLIPLTKVQHFKFHAELKRLDKIFISSLIGVYKEDNLLEEYKREFNQQSYKDSETKDPDLLLKELINDYIVQSSRLLKMFYEESIREINGLCG